MTRGDAKREIYLGKTAKQTSASPGPFRKDCISSLLEHKSKQLSIH